jgi:hypothetical protein
MEQKAEAYHKEARVLRARLNDLEDHNDALKQVARETITMVRPRVHVQGLVDRLRDLLDLVRGVVTLGARCGAGSALAAAYFWSGGAFEGLVPRFSQGVDPQERTVRVLSFSEVTCAIAAEVHADDILQIGTEPDQDGP